MVYQVGCLHPCSELLQNQFLVRSVFTTDLPCKRYYGTDKWLEQFIKIWETLFNQLDNLLLTIINNKK